MTRYLLLAAALAACTGKSDRADSSSSPDVALPAIDTLKPVSESESQSESEKKPSTRIQTQTQTQSPTRTQTQTRLGRDSAFPPPANLPRLDTVKKKPLR